MNSQIILTCFCVILLISFTGQQTPTPAPVPTPIPPSPSPSDPLVFTGGIISVTDDESCDDIYTNNGLANTTDADTLNCNKASVLVLQIPLVETPVTGGAFTYRFTPNGQSGGGQYTSDQALCEEKGPGYCLFGQPFDILVTVSPVVTAFELQEQGIAAPFGYLYENCLSKAPATDNTFFPYYSDASCGPADIWDEQDYRTCQDTTSFPYFYDTGRGQSPNLVSSPTLYSKCLFMCGWEIRKKNAELVSEGKTFDEWCNEDEQVIDVRDSYRQPSGEQNQLGCARAEKYTGDMIDLMPNFPQPTGFCPCANSATLRTTTDGQTGTITDDPPLASIVGCKSCAGAGSCGTALPAPEPDPNIPDQCDDMTDDRDTVCECVVNVPNSTTPGETEVSAEALTDPNTVCFNTNQVHRCLKCQFDIVSGSSKSFKECAYTDLNRYAFCNSYWNDICGAGDYDLGGKFSTDNDNDAAVGLCNCKGVFIERTSWVSPVCAPYRIQNPGLPKYEITVLLVPTSGTNSGIPVPGGTMTVGAGWASFDENNTEAVLSWINGTKDGFAVTEILSEYTKSGGYTSNLQGSIVMCNDAQGVNAFCDMSSQNDTQSEKLPNADIRTAPDKQGVRNPWSVFNNTLDAKVPLPDFLYKAIGNGNSTLSDLARNSTFNTWWYYLSQSEQDTYGLACGQNGWTMNGAADTATTKSMCAGPQGTCIPGIDRRLRGEAVQPPCSIAVDFLNYVSENNGKSTASTQAPPHVPPGWTSEFPQYYVDRGELRWTTDPLILDGNMNVRLRISIAADFDGVEVAQSNGNIEAKECFIATQNLVGVFQVTATNLGDVTSEFVFTRGPECSPGIDVPDYVVSLTPGPTLVNVPIQGTAEYNGENAQDQFCSISIAPSLLQGTDRITGSTERTQCTAQYSVPVIIPILSANVTYTERVADTLFFNYQNDPDCSGFLCGLVNGWKHGGFFDAFFMYIFSLFLTAFLTLLLAMAFVLVGKNINDITQQEIGNRQGMEQAIRDIESNRYIK